LCNNSIYFSANYDSTGEELWSLRDTTASSSVAIVKQQNNIKIYPNPSNGIFNVALNKEGVISIYDLYGKLIHTESASGRKEVNIQLNLTKGIYFLKFSNANSTETARILIE
jgi:hypothetical protein